MEIALVTMFFLDKSTGNLMCEISLVKGDKITRSFNKPIDELRKHPIQNSLCKIKPDKVEWQGHTWDDFEEFIEYIETAVLRSRRLEITELDIETEKLLSCSEQHRREILQQYRENYEKERREIEHKRWEEAQIANTKKSSENSGKQLGD